MIILSRNLKLIRSFMIDFNDRRCVDTATASIPASSRMNVRSWRAP